MNKIVPLEVDGAFLVYGQRFLDQRGYFEELYNQTKFEKPITPYNWQQVSIAESKPNVLRGLHCSNYAKYVTCVQGEVYDVIVDLRPDSPTYLKWTGVWLNADDAANPVHLYVPKRCGHGYFCKRASLFVYLQDGTYNPKEDIEINLFDTTAKVDWPKPIDSDSYIISEKDRSNHHLHEIPDLIRNKKVGNQYRDIVVLDDSGPEHIKWLVYGTSGFLGGHFVETVRKMPNHTFEFIRGSARLEDRRGLYEEINRHKPHRVVCMAGIAGKPDVLWCDRNQIETIRVNLIGQLNLLDVANQVGNIHCTILTTGGIYTYDDGEHKVGTGRAFTEDDPPNYNKLFYYETRIALEQLLKSYNNVLNLRIMYPTTHDITNPRSLISKLIRYKEIKSIPISITVMDDLWPVLVDMIEKRTIGTFNFNNPGTISHDEILNLYKEHVDPNHAWATAPFDSSRPAANLSADKLLKIGYKIPNIKDSVKNIMINHKKNLDESK